VLPETKPNTTTFTKVNNMTSISAVLPLQLPLPSVGLNAKSAPKPSAHLKQIGESTACSSGSQSTIKPESSKTLILYLIRHGEASHNVLEKIAKKRAKEECIAEGHAPDSSEVKQAMEEARKGVLHDTNLFDASLSDLGRQEATAASKKLQELVVNKGLTPPEEVLVSPLTRTLETADLIFPDHANIRVREELRERQTGLPPDSRRSTASLRRRPTFHRFSMSRIRLQSIMKNFALPQFAQLFLGDNSDDDDDDDDDLLNCDSSDSMMEETEEDQQMLRKRTEKLFELLGESDHSGLAIVTHKGYLRELERGQFEQPDAKEFNNCEIRVYRVTVGADKVLECAERIA
jgi:broad specificity phosphatase PhoE